MNKSKLYLQVLQLAGSKNVALKCCEELFELSAELGKAGAYILAGNPVFVDKIVDEMADAIITIEQVTGLHYIDALVAERVRCKLERLDDRYERGDIFKGLINIEEEENGKLQEL